MCGIAGIISRDPAKTNVKVLQQMAASIAHRGPDGQAVWVNGSSVCGFAHARLAIIDISEAGAQPMHYQSRYTIIYNGEIYNYIEIREDLIKRGYSFRSASDTEVILAAYACYKEHCVHHFDGMFAFAIWDDREQTLFCARDRFGEKPFFYYYDEANECFYFASEMKALEAAGLKRTMNKYLALQYLAHGYTSDVSDLSRTFDERFRKLIAAHYLIYSPARKSLVTRRYWQLNKNAVNRLPIAQARERFLELLTGSVSRRLRSDVPLGTSLSGGLDSSAIVAIMRKLDGGAVYKTFTAAFPGFEKDESVKALQTARSVGYDNYTVTPTASGFIDEFETMMFHQEEPVTSASVYAQYKVFELAKQHGVKVLLDGQGADETLGGYDKYRKWGYRAIFPSLTSRLLKLRERRRLIANKELDRPFVKQFSNHDRAYKPAVHQLNDLLYFDTMQHGLEELLRYADRNSMAFGREVRLPFLNAELVSFVFSLPSNYKIHGHWTKWILRLAVADRLPDDIVWNRHKVGFEPPQRVWMGMPGVIDYIHEARKKLVKENILNRSVLEKLPSAHMAYVSNGFDWRYMSLASTLR